MAISARVRGKLGLEFRGLNEVMRKLAPGGEVHQRVQAAVVQGITEAAEDLVGRAQREAPIDEGTLRASGTTVVYVNGRPISRNGPETFIAEEAERGHSASVAALAGFNTPYAIAQHERLDFHHPKGGKAKYLEDPLKQNAQRYGAHVAGRVAEALR